MHKQYEGLLSAFNSQQGQLFSLKQELRGRYLASGRFPESDGRQQIRQNTGSLAMQWHSMTPRSGSEYQRCPSHASASGDQTPLESLFPHTPAQEHDDLGITRGSEAVHSSEIASSRFEIAGLLEPMEVQGGFALSDFSKDLTVIPAEGWS
jgi:hypothetical protein